MLRSNQIRQLIGAEIETESEIGSINKFQIDINQN
jgi:hypothetical protein